MTSFIFQAVINAIPWWVLLIIALVGLGVVYAYAKPIWDLMPRPVKLLIGFVLSIVLAVQWGRNDGRKDELALEKERNNEAREKKGQIDAEVKNMPDDDVVRDLNRGGWLRDK